MSAFVYPDLGAVLIHIPKCGGYSIREGLLKDQHRIGPFFGTIPNEFVRFHCFAFTRDPYTRFVSAWRMFTQGTPEFLSAQPYNCLIPDLSASAFFDIISNEHISFGDRGRTNVVENMRHHGIPQTHPYNQIGYAHQILRSETYSDGLGMVLKKLGLPPASAPRLNRTDTGPSVVLDAGLVTKINNYFHFDFEILGYSPTSGQINLAEWNSVPDPRATDPEALRVALRRHGLLSSVGPSEVSRPAWPMRVRGFVARRLRGIAARLDLR